MTPFLIIISKQTAICHGKVAEPVVDHIHCTYHKDLLPLFLEHPPGDVR